jgi:thiol-disulfide isomerase/thioredoxin/cytochrome c-type biogenesis protein CcmH/NrfG
MEMFERGLGMANLFQRRDAKTAKRSERSMRASKQISLGFTFLILFGAAVSVSSLGRAQSGGSEFQTSMRAASQLMRESKFDDAVAEYRKAIQLSGGKDYAPYWGLAQAYNQLNDTKSVLSSCDQMLALAANDAERSLCHNLKGLALAKRGMEDKPSLALAEAEFRETLRLDSLYTAAYFNLGMTLLLENRDAEGVAELRAYLKALPDGADSDEAEQFIADPNSARKKASAPANDNAGAPSSTIGGADEKDSDASSGPPDDGEAYKSIRFMPGGPLPAMELATLQKQKLLTRSFRGKVVLLAFWATKCDQCDAAFPELQRINNENAKNNFVLISINEDDDEKVWRDSVNKNHPSWLQAWDQHGRALQQLFEGDSFPMPCYFIVDGNGLMHQFYAGWGNGQRRRIQSAINQWLAAPPAK